jgi:hypothetical protein
MPIYETDFAAFADSELVDGSRGWYSYTFSGGTDSWWKGAPGGGGIALRGLNFWSTSTPGVQDGAGGNVVARCVVRYPAHDSYVGPAIRIASRADASNPSSDPLPAHCRVLAGSNDPTLYLQDSDGLSVSVTASGGIPDGSILDIEGDGTTLWGKCQRPGDNLFLQTDGTWDAAEVWALTGTTTVTGQGYFGVIASQTSGTVLTTGVDYFSISSLSAVPTLACATNVGGTKIIGTPNETVTLTGDASDITLHGTSATVASVALVGGNVEMTLTGHIVQGATVTIDIAADFVEDADDNPNDPVTAGDVDNLSTQGIPSTPTGLDCDQEAVTSTTIPVSWDTMTGADGYLVQISEDSNFVVGVVTLETAIDSAVELWLEPGTPYYIRVAAKNDAGVSAYCVAITATTLAADLVAPTLTLVSKTSTTITVSFTEAEGGTAPYGYVLQVGTASEFFDVANIDPVSVGSNVITGLDPSSTYYIRCIVTDADDFQETSNELVVRTRAISSGRLSVGGGAGVSFGRGLVVGSGAGVQF